MSQALRCTKQNERNRRRSWKTPVSDFPKPLNDRSPNSVVDAKREKIADLLSYIEKRLEELEEEKEELKEFNKSDKERRCLEFTLHQREVEEASAALDRVEEERRNDVHASNTKRKEFNQREAIVQVSSCYDNSQSMLTGHSNMKRP